MQENYRDVAVYFFLSFISVVTILLCYRTVILFFMLYSQT